MSRFAQVQGLTQSLYRARQFRNLFRARLSEEEWRAVEGLLSPRLLALFRQMPGMGQRHTMDVCAALQRGGCHDPDVLTAALLHDVGKGRVNTGHRVAFVLLEWLAPRLLQRWAADRPGVWRRALYRMLNHEELGASLAAEAGAPAVVVTLIRNQEQPSLLPSPDSHHLALLRAADDAY